MLADIFTLNHNFMAFSVSLVWGGGMERISKGDADIGQNKWTVAALWKLPEELQSNIVPMVLGKSHKLVLATVYNCSKEESVKHQRMVDISESIYAFAPLTWLTTVMFTIVIAMLIKIHFSRYHGNHSPYWTTYCALMNQFNFQDFNYASRCLSTVLSLYVFLVVICYFESGIRSDKVTTFQPKVYDSYKEVIANPDIDIRWGYMFQFNYS